MATYDISVHCQDCGKVHLVLLRIDLDGGPDVQVLRFNLTIR